MITPDWPAPPGVRAAFTLRTGGVSVAPFDSLNLGSGIGDSPDAVAENRRRVRDMLRLPAEPIWLQQVHGIEVVRLGGVYTGAVHGRRTEGTVHGSSSTVGSAGERSSIPGPAEERSSTGTLTHKKDASRIAAKRAAPLAAEEGSRFVPIGDASVARDPGHVCAIRVADCMPVLFAARDGSAIAAAHAGWRGLAGGVLEASVRHLGVPPSLLMAWMGPAIGPAHFEVGDEVRAAFTATDAGAASAFVANARGRWQCDLYALARRRLEAIGVTGIYGGGWCTFSQADRFFSYRRNAQCGRMAALIWIESEQSERAD